MRPKLRLRLMLGLIPGLLPPVPARGQTLSITNGIRTFASLANTAVTLEGTSELWITAATNPVPGSALNLNSMDAWLFFPNIRPSVVATGCLSQVLIGGAKAVSGGNTRVVEYAMGTVVIPHSTTLRPLQAFTGPQFTGSSKYLGQYSPDSDGVLGAMNNAISSFKLKRGYMATFAQNGNGSGVSKTFVAQDGDLNVGVMPPGLKRSVSFVRVFPWRWTGKKGIAGDITENLNVRWYYNWNLNHNSSPDLEYVPIRQNRYWPDLNQNWRTRAASHLLGFNEPDRPDQADLSVTDAISAWPDLLATGLRLGAPAVSDGGLDWLYSFIDQADAVGLRVDFVPVHYYRCHGDAADPDGTAGQFYSFLKDIHDRVKRPLWVTEWNNGANWTGCPDPTFAQQQAAILKMTDMLDATPFVERYAIYNWVEDVRRVQWDDGSLTSAGVTYRDRISPLSYVQDGPPGGSRSSSRFEFEGDALDTSGYGNNGLEVGIPSYTTGHIGQGVKLDGVNSYIQLPLNTANSTSFSFAAWVNWEGGGNWQRLFDFGNDSSHYMFLTPKSGSGTMRFVINAGGGEQMLEAAAPPVGQWRHLAVTLSGNVARLYLNGTVIASSTSFTVNPSQFSPGKNFLGKSQFVADPLFRGRIDEVSITDYALSPTDIARMNAPVIRAHSFQPGGAFVIQASGSPSQAYELQTTAELIPSPVWTTIATATANGAGTMQFTDTTAASSPQRLYRISIP